jgi:hypothetical protein
MTNTVLSTRVILMFIGSINLALSCKNRIRHWQQHQ